MSWDQDYSVPSYMELLFKLTDKNHQDLLGFLEADLRDRLGISVVKTEEILLDEGYFEDVTGLKVTLSDGRVFVPKLVERLTEDGNYGRDTYEYVLENENPEVACVDRESGDPQIEPGLDIPQEYVEDEVNHGWEG